MRYGTKEGTVDVTEGMIIDFGNELDKFNQYIQEGKLIAYGGAPKAFIILEYNEVADETTITAGIYSLALAWNPKPTDNTKNVPYRPTLTWSPGDYAVAHDVYFGTSWDDVNDADTSDLTGIYRGRQDPNSYTPPEALELGEIYYWRIDEVNEPNMWKGPVWSFMLSEYIVVDDMEAYNESANEICKTWKDGTADFSSGSELQLDLVTFHGGEKSMKYLYKNNGLYGEPYFSEIEREYSSAEDWSEDRGDIRALDLWFYGDPNNDVNDTEQLYVGLEDSSGAGSYAEVRYDDMSDLQNEQWQVWHIDLEDFTDLNLASIKKVYIGFGDRDSHPDPGGSGTVYFDDIRLYTCRPGGSRSDLNNDCVIDFKDFAIMVDEWLSEILWP